MTEEPTDLNKICHGIVMVFQDLESLQRRLPVGSPAVHELIEVKVNLWNIAQRIIDIVGELEDLCLIVKTSTKD